MNTTRQSDSTSYLDAAASDPNVLGWMRGSPPPPDKRIRFENDGFWRFPQSRWSLSHMRALLPSANVPRVGKVPDDRGVATSRAHAACLSDLGRFASHPDASAANDPITMPAFGTRARMLMR